MCLEVYDFYLSPYFVAFLGWFISDCELSETNFMCKYHFQPSLNLTTQKIRGDVSRCGQLK